MEVEQPEPEPKQPEPEEPKQPEPKKRGRPPGAKNKPKIVAVPEEPKTDSVEIAEKEQQVETPALLTRAQVLSLLRESYRVSEQEAAEAKRQRYATLFAKR